MDLGTVVGLLIAGVGIIVGMMLEGGNLLHILQPTAAMIVFGGTAGATMVNFPLKTFVAALKDLRKVFFDKKTDPEAMIGEIVECANKARKDGILALEATLPAIKDAFLRRALSAAVDGMAPKAAREALELELFYEHEAGEVIPKVYEAAGGFAPTVGILGAVLGLIETMQHLDKIDEVGKGIAIAFVATIYGVGSANLLFLPAAGKLKIKHRNEMIVREMIVEGVIGILEGLSPRVLEERLRAFVAHSVAKAKQEQAKK